MAKNKIIYGGDVLIDLTADTVTADKVLEGYTFHDKAGEILEGECTFDSDTSEDTASVAEILVGKTAHARGALLTGTMPDNGGVSGTISTKDGQYAVPQGYHDGSGKVQLDATEKAKIIGANIKAGVEILGQIGTYSGEEIYAQAKTATPTTSQQAILPDVGYDYLSQVTILAIPYVETLNAAGGYTVTIG